jgi:hypothetical protein
MDMPYVHIEAPYTSSRAFVCARKAPLYGAVGLNSSIPQSLVSKAHIPSMTTKTPFNVNQLMSGGTNLVHPLPVLLVCSAW